MAATEHVPQAAPGPDRVPGGRRFRIGRSSDNDIVLVDDTVSRHHAELRFLDDGRLLLVDVGSRHGTRLNQWGEPGPVRQAFVAADDTVQFGDMEVSIAEMVEEIRLKHPELPVALAEHALERCGCGALRRPREACPECGAS